MQQIQSTTAEVINFSKYRAQAWVDRLTPEQQFKLFAIQQCGIFTEGQIAQLLSNHMSIDQLFTHVANAWTTLGKEC